MKFRNIYLIPIALVSFAAVFVPLVLLVEIPDDSILIYSDDDFKKYNFSGSGTEADPYLIENLQFTKQRKDSDYYAITIYSTTKYFIIRDCLIMNFEGGISISRVNDSTAIIYNNFIENCNYKKGISIHQSKYVQVVNNSISRTETAISLSSSDNCLIQNNTVYYNDDGIKVEYSDNVEIKSNNCFVNMRSIYISKSQFVKITNNTINSGFDLDETKSILNFHSSISTASLKVFEGFNLEILNNTVINRIQYGFLFQSLYFSNISFNLIDNTTRGKDEGMGMYFYSSENNTVTFNLIADQRKYVMCLDASENNLFHHNAFIADFGYVDLCVIGNFGYNNTWYDSISMKGNYWDGWDFNKPYTIPKELTMDLYPLESPPLELETLLYT